MENKSKFNWYNLLTFVITTIIAIAGLFLNNHFSSKRDFNNKLRDIRLNYLVDAYRKLSDSSQRIPNYDYYSKMESAISDIQLFGTKSQIDKAIDFMNEYKNEGIGDLDPLLNDLRNDLREDLKLEPIIDNVHWFRPSGVLDISDENIKDILKKYQNTQKLNK